MRIALINEFSQASKNKAILETLEKTVLDKGYQVFNTGMSYVDNVNDKEDDYTKENPRLTYIHAGIQAALLLNSGAVDFVITGCGTGQGALLGCNMFPGVVCGYCIDPTDAFLFLQINNGNAVSIPFAKGFGWGAELNLQYIFEKIFDSPTGMGYPLNKKESQNKNAKLLMEIKSKVSLPLIDALERLDKEIVVRALTPRFLECFNANCKDKDLYHFVHRLLEGSSQRFS